MTTAHNIRRHTDKSGCHMAYHKTHRQYHQHRNLGRRFPITSAEVYRVQDCHNHPYQNNRNLHNTLYRTYHYQVYVRDRLVSIYLVTYLGSTSHQRLNRSICSKVAYSSPSIFRQGPRRRITSVLSNSLIVPARALSYESPVLRSDDSIAARHC
jgi:hypothetical protein